MAVFSWICDVPGTELRDQFAPVFAELGLQFEDSFCNHHQVYAEDRRDGSVPAEARVKVLVSWVSPQQQRAQVEVRSSEAQLRSSTRCEQVAHCLQSQFS